MDKLIPLSFFSSNLKCEWNRDIFKSIWVINQTGKKNETNVSPLLFDSRWLKHIN